MHNLQFEFRIVSKGIPNQFNFWPKLLGYLILENPKMLLTILEFTAKLLNIYPALCSQIWLAKKVPTIFEYNSFMTLIIQSTLEKYIVAWNVLILIFSTSAQNGGNKR